MLLQTIIYNNQYVVRKRISAGSFGTVYLGFDLQTQSHVAIKVEFDKESMSLQREEQILRRLIGIPQIPKLYWVGKDNNCTIMVQQLLGKDLSHYFRKQHPFSIQCVILIAIQMLDILENIHNNGVLHRDIKPENVVYDNEGKLFLIDFGISKIFRQNEDKIIKFSDGKPFIGTTRYASINAHRGYELCRKDDLESLGYMLMYLLNKNYFKSYLLKGSLPWQFGQCQNENDKIDKVGNLKVQITSNELCKNLPSEFARYLDIVKCMKYREKPDYKYLQCLFERVGKQLKGYIKFDWFQERLNRRSSTTQFQHQLVFSPEKKKNNTRQRISSQQSILNQVHQQYRRVTLDKMQENGIKEQRNRSVSNSNNSSEYSDIQIDGSLIPDYQSNSFQGEQFLFSPKNNNIQKNQQNLHKVAFEFGMSQINTSLVELQLGILRQQRKGSEFQLNDDDSPKLENKINQLQKGSIDNQFKNPIILQKQESLNI